MKFAVPLLTLHSNQNEVPQAQFVTYKTSGLGFPSASPHCQLQRTQSELKIFFLIRDQRKQKRRERRFWIAIHTNSKRVILTKRSVFLPWKISCVQIATILSLVLVLPVNSVNSARNNDIVIKICRHDHISILYFSYFFNQMLLYAIDAVSFLHFTIFHHRSSFHNFN